MAEVSFYHDTRRVKKNGAYPLKIYLYISRKTERLYPIGTDLTIEQFSKSYLSPKPRGEYRELKMKLEAIKVKAESIVKNLGEEITFEKFERQFYRNSGLSTDVITYCTDYIKQLKKEGREGTADLYRLSTQSINEYILNTKGKAPSKLYFKQLTPEFLTEYETWFVNKGTGQSKTTVGIYLRNIRHLFNLAIKAGDISQDIYPFNKYRIPTGKNVKQAMHNDCLKALFTSEVDENTPIAKARDFWFFSYQCNGMNFRDIAELRWKNVKESYFSFLRHKTQHTTKDDPQPIIVPITDFVKNIIEKYGASSRHPHDYLFPIFTKEMDEVEKLRINRNFIRFVSQHMQSLADKLELGIKVNTLSARHSFTTNVTRSSGNLTFAQEALGHKTLNTTQNYWAGFEDTVKMDFANKLMDF